MDRWSGSEETEMAIGVGMAVGAEDARQGRGDEP
jgi:hypothetical protein